MLVSIDVKKGIVEMAEWKPVTWLGFFVAVASAVLVIAYAVYYEISFLRMMLYFIPSLGVGLYFSYIRRKQENSGAIPAYKKAAWQQWGRFLWFSFLLMYGLFLVSYMEKKDDKAIHQSINSQTVLTNNGEQNVSK